MKEKFSKRVQSIIKKSKEEAIELGHSYVGSEHILLGLLKVNSGKGKKILDIFNININCSIFKIYHPNTPKESGPIASPISKT